MFGKKKEQVLEAVLFEGDVDLEVVGEASYQDTLWGLVPDGPGADKVRQEAIALLMPEPENPHDAMAVKVLIEARLVGYLSRSDAKRYQPGIWSLIRSEGKAVAVRAVIAGGGERQDGPGKLGVWLKIDPQDFS